MTDNKGSVETDHLPGCAHSSAVAMLTVTAFRWERQFQHCADCGCTFTAQWRDTYVEPVGTSAHAVVA